MDEDDMMMLNANQEAQVDILMDMGFPYSRCLSALKSHGWNLETATDSLITCDPSIMPELISHSSTISEVDIPSLTPCPMSRDSTLKLELYQAVNDGADVAEATRVLNKMALAYREGTLAMSLRQKLKNDLVRGRNLRELEYDMDEAIGSAISQATRNFLSPSEAERLDLFRQVSGDGVSTVTVPPPASLLAARELRMEQDLEYEETLRRDKETMQLKAAALQRMQDDALRAEALVCRRLQIAETYRQQRAARQDGRGLTHPIRVAVHCNISTFLPVSSDSNMTGSSVSSNRELFFFSREELSSPAGIIALAMLVAGLLVDMWLKNEGTRAHSSQMESNADSTPIKSTAPVLESTRSTTCLSVDDAEAMSGLQFEVYQTLPMRRMFAVSNGNVTVDIGEDGMPLTLESCGLNGGGNVRVEGIECSW